MGIWSSHQLCNFTNNLIVKMRHSVIFCLFATVFRLIDYVVAPFYSSVGEACQFLPIFTNFAGEFVRAWSGTCLTDWAERADTWRELINVGPETENAHSPSTGLVLDLTRIAIFIMTLLDSDKSSVFIRPWDLSWKKCSDEQGSCVHNCIDVLVIWL